MVYKTLALIAEWQVLLYCHVGPPMGDRWSGQDGGVQEHGYIYIERDMRNTHEKKYVKDLFIY